VFVTGHEDPQKIKSPVKWKTLAKSAETIVIMMGLSRIGTISRELVAGGLAKTTPVAVIQNGTSEKHRMIVGTLVNIAQKIKENKIMPPSIIIIGNVVRLHKTVGWKK
jgi:uroporphyrin-III C-methyltransferase